MANGGRVGVYDNIMKTGGPGSAPTEDPYSGLKSDYYTLFTSAGRTDLLLPLPNWTKVTLRLESAGPVVVGTREDLRPIGSGKGMLLPVDEAVEMNMVPLTRLFISADSIQRVSVRVEPYPWLYEILKSAKSIAPSLGSMMAKLLGGVAGGRR